MSLILGIVGLRLLDKVRTIHSGPTRNGGFSDAKINERRKYWIRLNTAINHFNLPIDTWSVGNT
ncbi:MAG: hypothetical protein ACWGNO_10105, partial [Desulfobacterales bacterium]